MFYRGIKYPFCRSKNEFVASSIDNDVIRESILQIIQTRVGSRVMRPDFGCKLYDYIFDNENDLMIENIKNEIIRSITLFEPRAKVVNIDISLNNEVVDITLIYDTNFKPNNVLEFSVVRG